MKSLNTSKPTISDFAKRKERMRRLDGSSHLLVDHSPRSYAPNEDGISIFFYSLFKKGKE